MNKVFVDSEVMLDLLAHRLPHFHFSALLFTFADMKKLELRDILECWMGIFLTKKFLFV